MYGISSALLQYNLCADILTTCLSSSKATPFSPSKTAFNILSISGLVVANFLLFDFALFRYAVITNETGPSLK